MHDALFLPRELFYPATAAVPAAVKPSPSNRVAAQFSSGEAVAADLLQGVVSLADWSNARPDRRRQPRSEKELGVDLHLGDRAA
jgi:hypothetical protein